MPDPWDLCHDCDYDFHTDQEIVPVGTPAQPKATIYLCRECYRRYEEDEFSCETSL